MTYQIDLGKLKKDIGSAISQVSQRMRRIETQVEDEPTRYLVAGSHLTANSLVGATSVNVSTFPAWMKGGTIRTWILVDAGTPEAEVRQIVSVTEEVVVFTTALAYAHAEGDPVIFLDEPNANVKWFGAVGDNVADDAPAFQAAIDQMAIIGGGVVKAPPGIFKMNSSLSVTANGISFVGAGRIITLIAQTPPATAITYTGVSNFEIRDMAVVYVNIVNCSSFLLKDLRMDAGATKTGDALFIDGSNTFVIDNLHVGGTLRGIVIEDSSEFLVSNCFVDDLGGTALVQSYAIKTSRCSFFSVSHNIIVGNGTNIDYGVYADDCDNLAFLGNISANVDIYHIVMWDCNNFSFSGNTANASATRAYLLNNCKRGTFQGNVSNTNAQYLETISGCEDILFGGLAHGESRLFSSGGMINGNTRMKFTNVFSEWLPAEDFDKAAGTIALTRIGPANEDPYAWVIPATTADFAENIAVLWRVPHNLWGQTLFITPVWYWNIGIGALVNPPAISVTTLITGRTPVGGVGGATAYNHTQVYISSLSGLVRIEPWLYYAALDSGRTKQSLEVQLSIVKTGASGLLSGAIHIYGIELRFSSRMEG